MEIVDTKTIISAKPLYPNIMADDAEKTIIEMHKNILSSETNLAHMWMSVNEMKEELNKKKQDYNKMIQLFDVKYNTKEFNEIKNNSGLQVINPDDYRNH